MNRIERLTAILLLLQQKSCTSQEIARHFEVSKRTVLRDVQALCEMGVPIIAREGVGGGYALPPDYHLAPLPLTAHEAFLLLLALRSLAQLSDAPFAEQRASLLAKLHATLPRHQLSQVDQMLATVEMAVPKRSQRAPLLEPLLEAAQQQRWVKVTYQSAERCSEQQLLPRHLTTHNGFWYCHAYAYEHGAERIYRVDRILSLQPADTQFEHVAVPQPLPYDHGSHPEVIVRLTARGVAYVESEPHLGQHIQRCPDSTGELVFRCPPGELDWYARYFASLGTEAHVIAPTALRERLAQLGSNLADRYGQW